MECVQCVVKLQIGDNCARTARVRKGRRSRGGTETESGGEGRGRGQAEGRVFLVKEKKYGIPWILMTPLLSSTGVE